MSAADHKQTVHRFYDEVWSKGDMDLVDEQCAPEYVNYDPATPGGSVRGPEAFKGLATMYRTAFPDLHFTVEEQLAEGDTVSTRWTATGTQRGALMGIPPTGKRANVSGIALTRFSRGKIAEVQVVWDTLGLLQQLGAAPSPSEPAAQRR